MRADMFPHKLTLETSDGANRRVERVGASAWGGVYREETGSYLYRLIPIDDIRDAEKREATHRQIGEPRRRLIAPIVDSAQRTLNGQGFYYVRYEVRPDVIWQDVVRDQPLRARLEYGVQVLRALPYWWETLYEGFLPMPADICFLKKDPFILALPAFLGFPRLESLFAVAERILYLAPEVLRGQPTATGKKGLDLYAVGAALMQGLYGLRTELKADGLLPISATGRLFTAKNLERRLPLWVDKAERVNEILATVQAVVDPDAGRRSGLNPLNIAKAIEERLKFFDPNSVAAELREKGQAGKAYSLLQDVYLENPTSELYALGGEIAQDDLKRPLEAVQLYERAIKKDAGNIAAKRAQLRILLRKETLALLALQIEQRLSISEKLDEMIDRDFKGIPVLEQKGLVVDTARYFNWRRKHEQAAKLLYNFLFEGSTFLWWEFPKTLAYAESLIGMERLEESSEFLAGIKTKLMKVRDERRMDPQKIHEYAKEYSRLEAMLFDLRQKKGGTYAPGH